MFASNLPPSSSPSITAPFITLLCATSRPTELKGHGSRASALGGSNSASASALGQDPLASLADDEQYVSTDSAVFYAPRVDLARSLRPFADFALLRLPVPSLNLSHLVPRLFEHYSLPPL